jgi:UDP-GlcNAc:undecaprenyl-phosphate/decaprenyl-phosphate GlcNAc-1-phosphate transferase
VEAVLFSFLTSFMVTVFFTPSLIMVAKLKNLNDEPGERKLHKRKIPTIGGIMIFASTVFAYALWYPEENIRDFHYIIAATLTLFFVGIKDDIIGTAPIKKLVANMLVAMCIVLMADIRIKSLHGIFNVFEIPLWASIFLSVFTIIVIINAFNLIDGIDGLASGIGLIVALSFAVWFTLQGDYTTASLAYSLAGALLGFLSFNFSPARIFMGDSGSLTIGIIVAILAIKLIEFDREKLVDPLRYISKPVFAISVLIFPLFDTLRIFLYRIIRGSHPFSADKNHVHHKMLELGLNHRQTSLLLYGANLLIILVSVSLQFLDPSILLLIIAVLSTIIFQIPFLIRLTEKKPDNKEDNSDAQTQA